MTETLEGFMIRMVSFKETVEWMLLNCEDCDRRNWEYFDVVLGSLIKDLREIILGGKESK